MNIGKGSGSVVVRHTGKEHADSSDRKRDQRNEYNNKGSRTPQKHRKEAITTTCLLVDAARIVLEKNTKLIRQKTDSRGG